MKRIIASAGAWGYGPCVTLIMVLRELSCDYEVDFVGNGVALEYATLHSGIFKTMYQKIEEVEGQYDLAISVIEPTILLWAKYRNIASICIDNLYWLWEWSDEFLTSIDQETYTIERIQDIPKIREITGKISKYGDYSFMYALPQKTFLQGFTKKVPISLKRYEDKTELIQPILDLRYKREEKKDKIIVSFSGMKNPYVSQKDIETYIMFIKELFQGVKEDKIFYAMPEEFVTYGKEILKNKNVACLSHEEMLKKINESLLLFAPAGMATMFEAIAYQTMLFVLPEQHDGNYSNYETFCDTCSELVGYDVRTYFPELMLGSRIPHASSFEIHEFYEYYSSILEGKNKELLEELKGKINEFLEEKIDDGKILSYTEHQEKAAKDLMGDSCGVRQIVSFIESW